MKLPTSIAGILINSILLCLIIKYYHAELLCAAEGFLEALFKVSINLLMQCDATLWTIKLVLKDIFFSMSL